MKFLKSLKFYRLYLALIFVAVGYFISLRQFKNADEGFVTNAVVNDVKIANDGKGPCWMHYDYEVAGTKYSTRSICHKKDVKVGEQLVLEYSFRQDGVVLAHVKAEKNPWLAFYGSLALAFAMIIAHFYEQYKKQKAVPVKNGKGKN